LLPLGSDSLGKGRRSAIFAGYVFSDYILRETGWKSNIFLRFKQPAVVNRRYKAPE
jgi:hypothetical protein